LAPLLALTLLPGCSNDLDDLFCDSDCPVETPAAAADDPDADAALEVDAARLLPIRPDPKVEEACADCSEVRCREAREACLLDDACTEQLYCMDACHDPGCWEECRGLAGVEGPSPYLSDLVVCTHGGCAEECRTGENWACAEEYQWPPSDAQTIHNRLQFGGRFRWGAVDTRGNESRVSLMGAKLSVCDELLSGCVAAGELDASNAADVELPTVNQGRNFLGFFEIDNGDLGIVASKYRAFLPPLSRDGRFELVMITDLLPFSEFLWLPAEDTASLWVYVVDCTVLAARVYVEIVGRPDVPVAYLGPNGRFNADGDEAAQGVAFFPELSVTPSGLSTDEAITIQAFLLDEDGNKQVVAKREIALRAGYEHVAVVAPRTLRGD